MFWQPLSVESWIGMRRGSLSDTKDTVNTIIEDVKTNGDAVLFALTEKFDLTIRNLIRSVSRRRRSMLPMIWLRPNWCRH